MGAKDIERFVSAVAHAAGDEEADERGRSAAGAVDLLKRGQPTPGLTRMREVWGTELADTATTWLKVKFDTRSAGDAERIDALARLDRIGYDQQRTTAAQELGVRTTTLDKEVAKRREELAKERDAEPGFLQPPDLWPEPVPGDDVLSEICEVLRRHIVLTPSCRIATALWVLHAHAHGAAQHSPILFISSPTKRCGKTNLLSTIAMLVPKPLSAANVTPATVFRAIDYWLPTMLIDEMDTFLSDKSELRGVLNSGHTRAQAYVVRCVGDDHVPKPFSTWAPKAFACIGRMHPTLEGSIPIEMKRKLPSERVSPIPRSRHAAKNV
jgi:putative DNA primase/helicase